jgi:membrane protein implicated in regulation of membrane protease activity
MLKIFSWLGYLAGAVFLIALFVEGEMSFLVPAIAAIASGVVFAAFDVVIVELKGIRLAISGGVEEIASGTPAREQIPLNADEETFRANYEAKIRDDALLKPS